MSRRRTKYALMTGALLATITGTLGIAIALGDTYSVRLDASATREQSLDERTARLIDDLEREHELVLSADLSALPDAGARALGDLLDALDRRSENMRVTIVDDRDALADLITRLSERDRAVVDEHRDALVRAREHIAESARAGAELLTRLSDREMTSATDRAALDASIAAISRAVDELSAYDGDIEPQIDAPYPGVSLPDAPAALEALAEPAERAVTAFDALGADLARWRQRAVTGADLDFSAWTGACADRLNVAREALLRGVDAMSRLQPLEPLRVARVVTAREAALLLAPRRTVLVELSSLVPDPSMSGADAVTHVRNGEATLATALASAAVDHPPIVVIVHVANEALLDARGVPTPQAAPVLGAFAQQMSRRGIDLAEWRIASREPMPERVALDPSGLRPIVWMCPGAPIPGSPGRYQRTIELASALRRLADRGESLLLTLPPSDAQAAGETDPLADLARGFGVEVVTSTPLVSSVEGVGVQQYQTVREVGADGPLAPSLKGLPTLLHLPVPIDVLDPAPAGVEVSPLLLVGAEGTTWGESSWLAMATGNATPTRDPARDRLDASFIVSVSASRARIAGEPSPTVEGTQRCVIVTGYPWFTTEVMTGETGVDGRRALLFPGNSALVGSAVSYLAGLDELLAREARTPDIARIGAIPDGQLLALRLGLVIGLPLGILAIGAVWRLVRG